MNLLWVFVGGGLGSICRYAVARGLDSSGFLFPMATFLTNGISCVILGILLGLSLRDGFEHHHRLLLITGFCGGFSTFSTFSAETLQLFQSGHHLHALANIFLSLIVCLVCIYLGLKIIQS